MDLLCPGWENKKSGNLQDRGNLSRGQTVKDMGMLPAQFTLRDGIGLWWAAGRGISWGTYEGLCHMEMEEHVSLAYGSALTLVNNHQHQQRLG